MIVESKADDTYPIVSAASICAKVTRDHILKNWEFEEHHTHSDSYSREFGCGYPGDSITKKWLRDHCDQTYGFPSLVRFSWKTARTLLEDQGIFINF